MKLLLAVPLAAIAAATFASAVIAMPDGAAPKKGSSAHPMDCAKAKDKTRCESLNKDIETCRSKTGDAWRECMHQPAPSGSFAPPKARDCKQARNQERCEAHTGALEVCKHKTTAVEHRRCMAAQAANPGKD